VKKSKYINKTHVREFQKFKFKILCYLLVKDTDKRIHGKELKQIIKTSHNKGVREEDLRSFQSKKLSDNQ